MEAVSPGLAACLFFRQSICYSGAEVCAGRDVKGLYRKAFAGEIATFTGVSDPYEEPENAKIVVSTGRETPAESAARILDWLESRGYLRPEIVTENR